MSRLYFTYTSVGHDKITDFTLYNITDIDHAFQVGVMQGEQTRAGYHISVPNV